MTATILTLSRLRQAATHLVLGVALLFPALQANAGEFTLDWATIDWPAGQKGPYLIPLFDSNGFRIDTVIGATGTFAAAPTSPTPDDLTIFGGGIEGFTMIADAGPLNGSVGESTVVSTMRFFSSGVPFGVNGLTHTISDIDSSDNNQFDDRCDFFTITGDAGNPALTAVSATPTFIIGPGPGTGLTGAIAANQAQCKYIEGLGVAPTSDNDITGTLRATYPNNTTLATIFYDESIGNVRGFRFDENPFSRGASTWEAVFFTATQAISLSAAPSITTAFQGDTVTYSYVVSNDGDLPFNTGQTIVIEDSRLGTLSCPPITSDVAPGETFTCTGSTTVSADDAAAGSISTTATAGIGSSGQLFSDRLQSNTDATLVTILSTAAPTFPTGPGLSSSACGVTSPTGNAWADIGLRWENSGTMSGSIDRSDIFASVGPQSVSGLTATINDNDLNIDRTTVPGVFSNSAYISYSFTTQPYAGIAEIYGIGIAGYSATQPFHNQKSGTFDYAIQIDDDPAFGSPQLLMADTRMQDGTMPGAASVFVSDFGTAIYNFAHYDASGSVVKLDPATTYYMRIYPYNDTASGMDNGQPYTDIVLWDDFMLKAVSCSPTQIDAADDDYSATPVTGNSGGVAGNAYDNDTLNSDAIDTALINTTVLASATPASPGDPVPYLETTGAAEGDVVVPAWTPAGVYTITYEICETANPANCDPAEITVAVQVIPATPPFVCTPQSVFGSPRTQLAGAGSPSAISPSDIYVFDNVTVDSFGNAIDIVMQLDTVSSASDIQFEDTLNTITARMTPNQNPYLTYRLSLVQDGTATVANPEGTPINQAGINGVIVQQTDIDSRGGSDDSSDVGGFVNGSPTITHFNTIELPGFPSPGTAIAQDPAKFGSAANWIEEINESDFDNYVTFNFDTFQQNLFTLGYTGSSGNSATRGAGIRLCAIAEVSPTLTAEDDDYSATPVDTGTGGTLGNVLGNDTLSGDPVNSADVTITEITPAEPQTPGDPVPFIELAGASEGVVTVPLNTPIGTYTISYELCEDALVGNCDRAQVTVVVEEVLMGSITGTVYEDANGSVIFDLGEPTLPAGITISLYLDAGTPLNTLDDILIGTTFTLADGTYVFDLLPVGSYRIQIDTAAPQIPAGYTLTTGSLLVNVVVTDGQTTTNQDFGFAPPLADLSITKAALSTVDGTPVTTLQAGTAVDFVITLSNNGPGTPTGVVVQDLLQSGFAYVSDDSAASGTTYNSDTGLWTVGTLSPGSSQVLTVRATMLDTGVHTNIAEVIASSLNDPDSDPTVGAATDDLGDGIADDDEATVNLTLAPSGQVLSGRVFLDNGAGGATAHDGTVSSTETGTNQALVEILDDTGAVLATPEPNASGFWSYALPQGYTRAVTLRVTADNGLLNVSETAQALPALVNADASDGQLTFNPAAATDYLDLDVGLIRQATLTESQEASIGAGQVVTLRHEYLADSTGTVTFAITDITQTPADAFAGTLFADPDCDGVPDTLLVGAQSVSAGTRICLVARVVANSGLGQNAVYVFDLTAQTSYSDITFVETDTNTDRLISSGGLGNLVLTKTVRNETQATPEGQSNQGSVGDVLEYRIYVINPSQALATDVVIHDQTPAYTELAEPVPTPLLLGQGLTCTLSAPAVNAAGYAGALRWDCLGTLVPGEQGSVSFKVAIAP